jgi:hypothetical protein
MNLSIKNSLKTLQNTRKQITEKVAHLDALRLASVESVNVAHELARLRAQREDVLAVGLAAGQASNTEALDRQISEATINQARLADQAGAATKAIGLVENALNDLRLVEATQLSAVFAAYFNRFHVSERSALEKTEKALADFKEAAAQLAATHHACLVLHRGDYLDWQEVDHLLYTRFENNRTLRDITKDQAELIVKTVDDELTEALGLNLWQIRTKHPRQPMPAPENA